MGLSMENGVVGCECCVWKKMDGGCEEWDGRIVV